MKQKHTNDHLLYLAVTRKKGPKSLRRIMGGRAGAIVKSMLAGLAVPEKGRDKSAYFEGVSCISEKIMKRQANELVKKANRRKSKLVMKNEIGKITAKLKLLREALQLCELSCVQPAYAQFLGRKGFRIAPFMDSMKLFSSGRTVEFQQLSKEGKAVRRKVLRLAAERSQYSVEKLIGLLKKNIKSLGEAPELAYEVAAVLTKKKEIAKDLLEQYEPRTYKALERHLEKGEEDDAGVLFWNEKIDCYTRWDYLDVLSEIGIYLDPEEARLVLFDEYFDLHRIKGFIARDEAKLYERGMEGIAAENEMLVASRSAVQHELQHIFDHFALTKREWGDSAEEEYRAYLAELAFSEERLELCKKMIKEAEASKDESDDPHEKAGKRIGRMMAEAKTKSDEDIIETAKRLLNEAYAKACGLSYDQILEPFRK